MKYLKEHIIKVIKQNSKQLSSFGIANIGLFGSYAKIIENDNSDIDFLVEFELGKKNLIIL